MDSRTNAELGIANFVTASTVKDGDETVLHVTLDARPDVLRLNLGDGWKSYSLSEATTE